MSEVTTITQMRLSEGDRNRLDRIARKANTASRTDTIRYLILLGCKEHGLDVEAAGRPEKSKKIRPDT